MMPLMNLISIENLSKTLKDAPLFEGVSLGINLHDRIGLIGNNGAGKTTFLRLLTGDLETDTGMLARNRELKISILEQHPVFAEGSTIQEALYAGTSANIQLLNEYRACLDSYQHHGSSGAELAILTEKMDKNHGWEIENTYQSLLTELNITDYAQKINALSGGMTKKVALARSLASRPNLLILDEPTNHLDIQTIEWLEKFIVSSRLGCIVVTHDRYFLDSTCTKIFEIDREKIFTYEGNYSTFLERKEQRIAEEQAGQNKIEAILRVELEWLKRGPRARAGKNRGRKQRIQDLMDNRISNELEQSEFSSSHRRLGKKVLELTAIEKSYGDLKVINPFTYSFKQGERIGLIGTNGSGKTTFLDMITESITIDSGKIDKGINTKFGYYDQMNRPLKESLTVLEYISNISEQISLAPGQSVSAARFLEMFGFNTSFHRITLSRLSGGEKRRLFLISILIKNPNFLILDEPTNDLDIETLRKLEDYLNSFPGCVIIVSHDRAFLDRTTDFLFIFNGSGSIKGYAGIYSEYRQDYGFQQESITAPGSSAKAPKATSVPIKQRLDKKRKLTFKERQEFETLLESIDVLEEEKSTLEEIFTKTTIQPEQLEINNRRYTEVLRQIEDKSARWEHLAEIDEG
jgi:ABC transport system ATP-binding/permease protein